MVNYGISYGISAFGLAQRLGIPRAAAKTLIDGYFAQYPGIKQYMTDTVERARERGYVETITGRRRYLSDLRSANAAVRSSAERNAINMPIQGSSADLIKLAMIQIGKVARAENWRSKLLLQVHDELVFDLYLPEKDRVVAAVQDCMQHALPLAQCSHRRRGWFRCQLARGALKINEFDGRGTRDGPGRQAVLPSQFHALDFKFCPCTSR